MLTSRKHESTPWIGATLMQPPGCKAHSCTAPLLSRLITLRGGDDIGAGFLCTLRCDCHVEASAGTNTPPPPPPPSSSPQGRPIPPSFSFHSLGNYITHLALGPLSCFNGTAEAGSRSPGNINPKLLPPPSIKAEGKRRGEPSSRPALSFTISFTQMLLTRALSLFGLFPTQTRPREGSLLVSFLATDVPLRFGLSWP